MEALFNVVIVLNNERGGFGSTLQLRHCGARRDFGEARGQTLVVGAK